MKHYAIVLSCMLVGACSADVPKGFYELPDPCALGLTLSPNPTPQLQQGVSLTLRAKIDACVGSSAIAWKSINPAIAEITHAAGDSAVVKAISAGVTAIQVTSVADPNAKTSVAVQVVTFAGSFAS